MIMIGIMIGGIKVGSKTITSIEKFKSGVKNFRDTFVGSQ